MNYYFQEKNCGVYQGWTASDRGREPPASELAARHSPKANTHTHTHRHTHTHTQMAEEFSRGFDMQILFCWLRYRSSSAALETITFTWRAAGRLIISSRPFSAPGKLATTVSERRAALVCTGLALESVCTTAGLRRALVRPKKNITHTHTHTHTVSSAPVKRTDGANRLHWLKNRHRHYFTINTWHINPLGWLLQMEERQHINRLLWFSYSPPPLDRRLFG